MSVRRSTRPAETGVCVLAGWLQTTGGAPGSAAAVNRRIHRKNRHLLLALMLVGVLCWTPAAAIASAAQTLRLPPMAPIERGEYRARDARTGEGLWRHQWLIEQRERGGRITVSAREAGSGRRERTTPTTWTVQMELTLSGPSRRLAARREVRDASDALLEVTERELDFSGGSGRISTFAPRMGRPEVRQFPLSDTSIGVEMLAAELRILPNMAGGRMRIDLVTDEGRVVPIEAKIDGREAVAVPAGLFECYKISLTPIGILGRLADLLLSKISMWHTLAAPHVWVKYQGPEGGIGSRTILRELTRFEPQPTAAVVRRPEPG